MDSLSYCNWAGGWAGWLRLANYLTLVNNLGLWELSLRLWDLSLRLLLRNNLGLSLANDSRL